MNRDTPGLCWQRGVALITVLLVVAIVTVVAVAMASRQQIDIRRTGNVLDGDRAYLFALGVEEWAKQVLVRDGRDNETDALDEDWATILPPLTVEGAVVSGRIDDLQGRFNLNNLVDDEGKVSKDDVTRFKRLLDTLSLEQDLADAVADWIDEDDDTTFPGGAEETDYMGLEVPYRTANVPLVSPSELLLIKGCTTEVYETLEPFITTLPKRTPINVNTAAAEVIAALSPDITLGDAEELVELREEDSYESVKAFTGSDVLKDKKVPEDAIGVASEHFLVTIATQFGGAQTELYTLLSRTDKDKVHTLMRSRGVY